MEPCYTIALASLEKSEAIEEATVPIQGPYASEQEFDKGTQKDPHRFGLEEVESWTDVAALPLLPADERALDAFDQLQSAPRLDTDDSSEWRVRPYRTGITSSDCLDIGGPEEYDVEVWPVYKGESFDIWEPETGTYYGWGNKEELIEYLQDKRERGANHSRSAFYEMDNDWIADFDTLSCYHPRIAFRRVSRRDDTRTIKTALIPPNVFMRDADPFLLWPRGDRQDEAYLIGFLSSIPLDWFARRFVEEHLDYYIFNGLPIPRPGDDSELRQRVVELSGRLAAVDERYAGWADAVGVEYGPLDEAEQIAKIYELDAVVAHLYGLSREHLQVVFETFHEGWDYEERLTRVLEHYDEWADRLDGEER